MLPFEFVIAGPAVSQQTRRRARRSAWIDHVRRQAEGRWQREGSEDGPVALTLTYLHGEAPEIWTTSPNPFLMP